VTRSMLGARPRRTDGPQLSSEPAAVHAAKSLTACGSLDGPFFGMNPPEVQVKRPLLLMPPEMYWSLLSHE